MYHQKCKDEIMNEENEASDNIKGFIIAGDTSTEKYQVYNFEDGTL